MNAPVNNCAFLRRAGQEWREHAATILATGQDKRSRPRQQAAMCCEVLAAGRAHAAMISNISSEGLTLKFETEHCLAKGMQVSVRSNGLGPITGVVRWAERLQCGVLFSAALAGEALKDVAKLFDAGKRLRPGRARVRLDALISCGEIERRVTIENIGSGGVLVATGLSLGTGRHVSDSIVDCEPIDGRVRWSHLGRCGVMFTNLLPVAAAEVIAGRCSLHPSWLDEIRTSHAILNGRHIGPGND